MSTETPRKNQNRSEMEERRTTKGKAEDDVVGLGEGLVVVAGGVGEFSGMYVGS